MLRFQDKPRNKFLATLFLTILFAGFYFQFNYTLRQEHYFSSDANFLFINHNLEFFRWSKTSRSLSNFERLPEQYSRNITASLPAKNFLLRPRNIQELDQLFVLFVVKSAVHLYERRALVRNTWGTVSEINGLKFATIFVVGRTDNASQANDLIQQENDMFGDILQSDLSDSYMDLPEKVLSAYQWIYHELHNVSKFYAFTDDDCFVNVAVTYNYLYSNMKQLLSSNSMLCGYKFNARGEPVRINSKYRVSLEIYPEQAYPPFCHGGLSILTFHLLSDIYRMAEVTSTNGIHLEDVFITGILREKLGRGSSNIRSLMDKRERDVIRYEMGSMVWHLGATANLTRSFLYKWSLVTPLFNITLLNGTSVLGYRHSAKFLQATLRHL